MNKRKLRILFPTEFTGINTGFSTYSKELLQELYSANNYELAELACVTDPHAQIAMSDGSLRYISNIKVGDIVISHKGENKKVINTYKTLYDGQVIKISRHIFKHTSLEIGRAHVCTPVT